jgi:hypothetical protein
MIRLFLVLTVAVSAGAARAAPADMTAVPGGSVDVGNAEARRVVPVGAFFVDRARVTVGAYRACLAAGACPALALPQGGDDSDVALDWVSAERFCAFAGKRLLAEAEWETAAQAGAIRPSTTLAPGGKTPTLEWTNTWFVAGGSCKERNAPLTRYSQGTWAVALCGSVDVLDACDGVPFCGALGERVVKDPTAPTARAKAAARIGFEGTEAIGGPRHAVRCASTTERLAATLAVAAPPTPPRPADPTPPTTDERARFLAITEDVLDVPECEKAGRSFIDCRDPRSYLKTNEPRIGVVLPWITNRGGAYTGVASDQNYTFVAHARSQWVWLFDYDINVVRWHRVLRALVLEAGDRHGFVALFTPAKRAAAVAAIERHAADDPQKKDLVALFKAAADNLRSYYVKQETNPSFKFTWLGDDDLYSYVRLLYQQGRMYAFRGNMLDTGTMRTIGDAARALKVPVRIYYPSNAPEFWPFTDQYRSNVQGLPFDGESVVVQTISSKSLKTDFGQQSYWHYNVQGGLAQQARLGLRGITRHRQLLWHRTKSASTELTLSDVPGPPPTTPMAGQR